MDEADRLTYIGAFFTFEFDGVGKTHTLPISIWKEQILDDIEVDTVGTYKQYGVLRPVFIDGDYIIAICPELILRPVFSESDDTFHKWLEYWMLRLQLFVIVSNEAFFGGDIVTDVEVERRIEERLHGPFDDVVPQADYIRERGQ